MHAMKNIDRVALMELLLERNNEEARLVAPLKGKMKSIGQRQ
jgi:hypothetical protein